ncbi:MAG: MarR family winged helix-turn-helix transcriptional regulator [Gulosibacter sp.]|uniref:MarR family winged helix-turn-helix transcriptional regulator n=1 Tax=Gulosibacter sp. TaxID=2817531 RepID=UPI003F904A27
MTEKGGEDSSRSHVYSLNASDPAGELIDRTHVSDEESREISAVMQALGRLREAEQRLSDASLKYMKLNATDMRALHFLIVCGNTRTVATPGAIAAHLHISSASTTKLLDRLERGGHITRAPHPTDRRALAISVTEQTRQAAMDTVGRQQANRFYAVQRLSSSEREIVVRFLDDMAGEISLKDESWVKPE